MTAALARFKGDPDPDVELLMWNFPKKLHSSSNKATLQVAGGFPFFFESLGTSFLHAASTKPGHHQSGALKS